MSRTFQVAVDLTKWDGKKTQTIAEDAVSANELQQWVKAQEAAKNRYIVFPTTKHMINFRVNVQEVMLSHFGEAAQAGY